MAPEDATRGCLYVVGTPIGNLEDLTFRAARILREVDLVASEDTRRARVLLDHIGAKTATLSLFEGNEARRTEQLIERLSAGSQIALISDAGMPLISDPGGLLVRRCIEQQIPVDVIPGPSAVSTAVALSGIEAGRFRFVGFLPRRGRARKQLLGQLARSPEATVLFESPARLAATLAELRQTAGDQRRCAVLRELTKLHQEARRGTLAEVATHFADRPVRGECTIVLAADESAPAARDEAIEREVAQRVAEGQTPRQIADALGGGGVSRRRVYQLALRLREPDPDDGGR